MKFLYKLFKIIVAIALLPFCVGAVWALGKIILTTGSAGQVWVSLLGGVVSGVLVFLFLPDPKWLYVLGHELTHAIWTLPFGGRLKRIRVTSGGGHVITTKANFLTSLAPYFFPFYVLLVIVIFVIGNLIWDWSNYFFIFYFFIGVAYAFHLTLTFRILKIKQPDIVGQGYVFSTVIIFLGNILILLIGIPLLVAKGSVAGAFDLWFGKSIVIYNYLFSLF